MNIICSNCHDIKRSSQPLISGMPAGNLTVAAAILFSGEPTKGCLSLLSFFADILKLSFISESTYHDQYVFPVVDQTWKRHQEAVLQSKVGPVSIIGDGRCDSQGTVRSMVRTL